MIGSEYVKHREARTRQVMSGLQPRIRVSENNVQLASATTPATGESELDEDCIPSAQRLAELLHFSSNRKTIFSVVQSPPTASKAICKSTEMCPDNAGERIEKHVMEYDDISDDTENSQAVDVESYTDDSNHEMVEKITYCENENHIAPEIHVENNALLLTQFGSPDSSVFTANLRLENPKSYFLGYRVFCNYAAVNFFTVTSRMGVVPPQDSVDVIVSTKKTEQMITNAMVADATFIIKMFRTCSSEMSDSQLIYEYEQLCRDNPGVIFTNYIDKVALLCSENVNDFSTKSALDAVLNPWQRSLLKDELYKRYSKAKTDWESDEDDDIEPHTKKTSGTLSKIETAILRNNQQMRNCSRKLLSMARFYDRITNLSLTVSVFAIIYGCFNLYYV